MPNELKYRASGVLIASCHVRDEVWLVCVRHGNEFVVSNYRNGSEEWISGSYFFGSSDDENRRSALTEFASRLN